MLIFDADDPLVLNGTYDREGYKPGERARIAKAEKRREEEERMAKSKTQANANGKTSETTRGARSTPLPGMEQIRSKRLDNLCESIAEQREKMNSARVEEQSDIAAALQEMQKRGIHTFKHNGVELARVPGAEKLRVRLTKDNGDASDEDLEQSDEFDEERRDALSEA